MKDFLFALTGGRPMVVLDGCYFIDKITGEVYGYFVDGFGRRWRARSRWSWKRTPMKF